MFFHPPKISFRCRAICFHFVVTKNNTISSFRSEGCSYEGWNMNEGRQKQNNERELTIQTFLISIFVLSDVRSKLKLEVIRMKYWSSKVFSSASKIFSEDIEFSEWSCYQANICVPNKQKLSLWVQWPISAWASAWVLK